MNKIPLQSMNEALNITAGAILEYIKGNIENALKMLESAIKLDINCFESWLAKAEINYSQLKFEDALESAEKAFEINSKSVAINTTLSRIWIEKGEKKQAEYFNLQSRRLGWKEYIKRGKRVCKII